MTNQKSYFLVVKKSKINGKGIFSKIQFDRGVRITEYIGKRKKWKKLNIPKRNRVWLMGINDDLVIDGNEGGNIARYINHSCKPNCIAVLIGKRVFIETVRKIEINEEITIDYGLELGHKPTSEDYILFQCNCRDSKCRGTLLKA